MPVEPPYLYAAPARYSANNPYGGFDPKAVSRASLTPQPRRPKQEGPLIEFNKHPDSYLILPYGETGSEPLPRNTKKHVQNARGVQLGFRVLGMLGCLGTLVSTVCIKNTQNIETYVIRIPATFDVLFTGYALYHLIRPARARTPGSSMSYHFFACFIDACIIPFYVYIALAGRRRLAQPASDKDRWTALFGNTDTTNKFLQVIWLTSITTAGIHFVSFLLSVFLVIVFRRISNAPPDMNPLEDNLTSRRKTKHKYKNSEASSLPSTDSDAYLLDGGRSTPKLPEISERPMSFLHTRNPSSDRVYNPHNPITANASRSGFFAPSHPLYPAAAASRSSLVVTETLSERDPSRQASPSRQNERLPQDISASSFYSETPALPRKSSKRTSDGNWMVIEGSDDGSVHFDENREPRLPKITEADSSHKLKNPQSFRLHHDGDLGSAPRNARHTLPAAPTAGYASKVGLGESWRKDYRHIDPNAQINPLAMNPPTPVGWRSAASSRTERYDWADAHATPKPPAHRPLSALSANTQNSGNSSPRSKKYGDLDGAVKGIRSSPRPEDADYRGGAEEEKRRAASKGKVGPKRIRSGEWMGAQHYRKDIKPSANPYAFETDTNPSTYSDDSYEPPKPQQGTRRVASRSTGIDLADAPMVYDDWAAQTTTRPGGNGYGGLGHGDAFGGGFAGNGQRNVSGKVAEEGQAGYGLGAWAGVVRRRLAEGWR